MTLITKNFRDWRCVSLNY